MQIKTYRVKNMKQAKDAAVKELGPDVVMVSEKKVRQKGFSGFFKKRVLEVTFCVEESALPSVKKKAAFDTSFMQAQEIIAKQEESAPAVRHEELEARMDELASKLENFMDKFDIVKKGISYEYHEEVEALLTRLLDEQVKEELAHTLAKQTEKLMREKPGVKVTEILEHLLIEQFGRAEPILHKKFTQKVVLIIGPTGVGKTTTIGKLAAIFYKQSKNVGIINTDAFRIGAQGQLEEYANIMEAPFAGIYRPEELEEAMEVMADRDIIFVDTEGRRPGEESYKENLLKMIKILKPEDILLCLSATTSFASIKEMVDMYGFIDDYKVMVTKLDETKYRGTLLNISWYTNKPLAYVTTGQLVPDDIEIADIEKIVKEIINGN